MNYFTSISFCLLLSLSLSCSNSLTIEEEPQHLSGAGQALDAWNALRSYPDGRIYSSKIVEAHNQKKTAINFRDDVNEWTSMGPNNVGGRTLCLAFHPDNPDRIFAGSASGGLWETTSAGVGSNAWHPISTGFPVLGVPCIAFDPHDSNTMYIGTGEVYGLWENSMPAVLTNGTRGTYGIGILKTTDGGQTWTKALDWTLTDLRGVWDIVINPQNSNTIYTATTLGLLRSYDAGTSWDLIHDVPLAIDIEMSPTDTSDLFVTFGNMNPTGQFTTGTFRSTDAGNSFAIVEDLPIGHSGKAQISYSPSDPEVMYAIVHEANVSQGANPHGLFKSVDGGDSWEKVNTTNVAFWQGWYANDMAVHPNHSDTLIYAGIEVWKSVNGGDNLVKKSNWQAFFTGQLPAGGAEGSNNYVHADVHAVYYHPSNPSIIFLACDGGIFVSIDGGETWEGRNGGYHTSQFYANFSNSTSDPNFAIGGLQDNSTVIYRGESDWWKALSGDGMSTAINPVNDSIVFASAQNSILFRSFDKGDTWEFFTNPNLEPGETPAFNTPFELVPANPNVIYLGTQYLYRSEDNATTWEKVTSEPIDGSNQVVSLAIGRHNFNLMYASTAPIPFFAQQPASVLKSTDGGQTWVAMEGLPDRIAMDITIHPDFEQIAYIAYGGFNTQHVYKTENGGQTWFPQDEGLPDLPTNTIVIDPSFPERLYLGNDIGVYFSPNGGASWELFSESLPEAVLAMHLSISPSDRKLWLASHGHGAFSVDLIEEITAIDEVSPNSDQQLVISNIYPNPIVTQATLEFNLAAAAWISMKIFDTQGRVVNSVEQKRYNHGTHTEIISLATIPAGSYFLQIEGKSLSDGQVFRKAMQIIKS